ncbi:Bacterial Ig-like domain (group 2) [Planctomycetes bacterium Pan216]|uniref:Bacterial Ig-like domain (Group 2) n=1 Tax=Kolteria novifilia TaxID=2527975 RepID=A0A518B823_9BACT|nr:Bacterial Ig-like domain (group 2) [Planctomycetes bacterium Pan216]
MIRRVRFVAPIPLLALVLAPMSVIQAASAKDFTVSPAEVDRATPFDQVQIQVTDSTGPTDLTRNCSYESLTPKILSVDSLGRVRFLGPGNGRVRVAHGSKTKEVPFTVVDPKEGTPISFAEDIQPILTKAGCNQGACHASQFGQGGLILSLFGYAPKQDHRQLVEEWFGRRVSRARPDQSLVLLKATATVPHKGGPRFEVGSLDYQTLLAWIDQGTPGPTKEANVIDLELLPKERPYRENQTQQLRVVAHYSDGSVRDVTHRAKYDSMGEGVATVDSSGLITCVGKGLAPVMVRYQGQAKVTHVLCPHADSIDLAGFEPNNFVDEKVVDRWKQLGLSPSGLCSDEVFLRRAFLDATGTLPSTEKVASFLASTDPKKREHLVDELLGTGDFATAGSPYVEEWSAYWALKWGDLLRVNRNSIGDGGMWAFHHWIRDALRQNMPVDQFVREIISAQGSIFDNGPANYFKIATKPEDLAETTVQVFLGVRLQCARCHHHPFEEYSQADYYGLAAFFTRVRTKNSVAFGARDGDIVVMLRDKGSIRHPRTRETMSPTPLKGESMTIDPSVDPRRPLANWITSKENRLFARNVVNRIWGYLMGSGLVEPIDDMRETNPASNPALLDALADHFVESDFNLKELMRAIMVSKAYQLDSTPRPENVNQDRYYTHYNVKRLPAEALFDAVDFACGTKETFRGVPRNVRAIELPDPNFASYFLDTMGRPKRAVACECERTGEPNLAQVLHIANGDVVNRKLGDKKGRIAELLKVDDDQAIDTMYLVTLSRHSTKEELSRCKKVITNAPDRRLGLEDVLWALLNSREFLFNH